MTSQHPQVAIAGASGFIGRALVSSLMAQAKVVALSRRPAQSARPPEVGAPHWRQANLYNLRQTEQALEGAEVAVYLVHSMLPSARLSQGHFSDLDLICADNFARAAKRAKAQRIVYLSGLIPPDRPLSPHLASRLEIEHALADHGVPVVSLRAGIVVGPQGSSFTMMMRLIERLPVMVLPKWTSSRCQPIALEDVVAVLLRCILDENSGEKANREALAPGHYDVGGPDILTYSAMLKHCAAVTKRRRAFISVPLWTPSISLWWVRCITGAPLELVGPLVKSLKHDMVVREPLPPALAALTTTPFDHAVVAALDDQSHPNRRQTQALPPATRMAQRARGVISVQRLPLPLRRDAAWVAKEYSRFLPDALGFLGRWLLRVDEDAAPNLPGYRLRVYLRGLNVLLLGLEFSEDRSDADRQLFYLRGGLLVRETDPHEPGRFEFRSVLGRKHILCAVHDFVPRLPWLIYRFSQALVHALVMRRYGRFLQKK